MIFIFLFFFYVFLNGKLSLYRNKNDESAFKSYFSSAMGTVGNGHSKSSCAGQNTQA